MRPTPPAPNPSTPTRQAMRTSRSITTLALSTCAVLALTGCGDGSVPTAEGAETAGHHHGVTTLYGPESELGEGISRTYVVVDHEGRPREVGIRMSESVLTGLPDGPDGTDLHTISAAQAVGLFDAEGDDRAVDAVLRADVRAAAAIDAAVGKMRAYSRSRKSAMAATYRGRSLLPVVSNTLPVHCAASAAACSGLSTPVHGPSGSPSRNTR